MAEKVQSAIISLSDEAELKQQFINNFPHELRTPLASVFGLAEYLQKALLDHEEVPRIAGYVMEDSQLRVLPLVFLAVFSILHMSLFLCLV